MLQRRIKALIDGYAEARQAIRMANGLKVLLNVLCDSPCKSPGQSLATLKLRTYAVRTLEGLADDTSICHTLQNLQASSLPLLHFFQQYISEELWNHHIQVSHKLIEALISATLLLLFSNLLLHATRMMGINHHFSSEDITWSNLNLRLCSAWAISKDYVKKTRGFT